MLILKANYEYLGLKGKNTREINLEVIGETEKAFKVSISGIYAGCNSKKSFAVSTFVAKSQVQENIVPTWIIKSFVQDLRKKMNFCDITIIQD